jgi:hypothetical protein
MHMDLKFVLHFVSLICDTDNENRSFSANTLAAEANHVQNRTN